MGVSDDLNFCSVWGIVLFCKLNLCHITSQPNPCTLIWAYLRLGIIHFATVFPYSSLCENQDFWCTKFICQNPDFVVWNCIDFLLFVNFLGFWHLTFRIFQFLPFEFLTSWLSVFYIFCNDYHWTCLKEYISTYFRPFYAKN